jgi:hypothetical protein
MEAMVFCTVVFLGIQKAFGRPLTNKDIKSFIGHVRVYGDDIIVPVEFTPSVILALESFGFTVSKHKSYWNGKFRESCGQDAFDGYNINIVRLRKMIPQSRKQSAELVAFVEFRNQLYKAGYWKTVRALDFYIEKLIPFPATTEGSPGLGKVSFLGYESHKWDSQLQRPLVRAAVLQSKRRPSPLDGERALAKWFFFKKAHPLGDVILDKDHLQFAGRPLSVSITTKWIHPDYGMDVITER